MRRKKIMNDRKYWNEVKAQKKVDALRKEYEAFGWVVNSGTPQEKGVDMIARNDEEKRIHVLEITNWKITSFAKYERILRFCENLEKVRKSQQRQYPDYYIEGIIVISYHSNIDPYYYYLLERYKLGLKIDREYPLTKEDDLPEDFVLEWVE